MPLGLGNNLSTTGIVTPGIVSSELILKHNYAAGGVHPVSDGAAYFDGSQDYIKIDTSATDLFTLNTSDFAWAGWIKTETDAASEKIFDASDDSTNGFFIYIDSSGYVRVKCADVAGSFSSGTSPRDGLWHHVAVNFDRSGNATCYFDGVLDSTTVDISAEVSDSASCADDITIGINNDETSEDYKGYICNVGVWKRLLTQAEVKSIMWKNYSGLTSSETTSLVSWWNLSSDANDSHGSNNGTLA